MPRNHFFLIFFYHQCYYLSAKWDTPNPPSLGHLMSQGCLLIAPTLAFINSVRFEAKITKFRDLMNFLYLIIISFSIFSQQCHYRSAKWDTPNPPSLGHLLSQGCLLTAPTLGKAHVCHQLHGDESCNR